MSVLQMRFSNTVLAGLFSQHNRWIGKLALAQISITSNECSDKSDCNYFGSCVEGVCDCDDTHFGETCDLELPCPSLASEKAHTLGTCYLIVFVVQFKLILDLYLYMSLI